LIASLCAGCGDVDLEATTLTVPDEGGSSNVFTENFDSFDPSLWTCEGSCPDATGGSASFSLSPGVEPNNDESWSKIEFTPRAFTSGSFSVRFALSPRPAQTVFWGVALWNEGPLADQSQYSEINFGATTDVADNAHLDFVSARQGQKTSRSIDTGKDLYDGSFHTGTLVYTAGSVELYLDGQLLETINDAQFVATEPLALIIGTRLVDAPVLSSPFEMKVERTDIEW
jgi:hypothetical protein